MFRRDRSLRGERSTLSRRRELQLQLKSGADAVSARLQFERAAQELRPAAGEGQTQSDSAGGHVSRTTAAKRLKDAALLARRDAGSPIFDFEYGPGFVLIRTQPDAL